MGICAIRRPQSQTNQAPITFAQVCQLSPVRVTFLRTQLPVESPLQPIPPACPCQPHTGCLPTTAHSKSHLVKLSSSTANPQAMNSDPTWAQHLHITGMAAGGKINTGKSLEENRKSLSDQKTSRSHKEKEKMSTSRGGSQQEDGLCLSHPFPPSLPGKGTLGSVWPHKRN